MLLTPGQKRAVFHSLKNIHGDRENMVACAPAIANGKPLKNGGGLSTIVSCTIVAIIQEIPFHFIEEAESR